MINWDFVISVVILLGIILAFWAKISKQTIGELLRDIKEFFTDMKEENQEVAYYE